MERVDKLYAILISKSGLQGIDYFDLEKTTLEDISTLIERYISYGFQVKELGYVQHVELLD